MEDLTFREAAARLGGDPSPSTHTASHRTAFPRTRQAPPNARPDVVWAQNEYRILAAATDLYANQLLTHGPAFAYMAGRGFPRELLERFRVGWRRAHPIPPLATSSNWGSYSDRPRHGRWP